MTEHPGYAKADEVARVYEIRIDQVYRFAHRHKWRRYTLDGQARYHRDDVEQTLRPYVTA